MVPIEYNVSRLDDCCLRVNFTLLGFCSIIRVRALYPSLLTFRFNSCYRYQFLEIDYHVIVRDGKIIVNYFDNNSYTQRHGQFFHEES